ncbi:hypothetical protein GIB67_004581 [Kingdonia uniflora]|uniref:Uncharacterized protein n=1 Tax=Kingdonia uniflora TaxID=39325 RepID=A0A7J7MJ95_9MAGN|nr:hypothetical protein GIB67_004581 [Kingdonia uniflora]
MDILRGFRAELEEDRRIQIALWFRRKEMIIKLTLVVMAMTMVAKSKLLHRELKTVKTDLAFAKEKCAQLEEENRILRESREKGDNPEDNDLMKILPVQISPFGLAISAATGGIVFAKRVKSGSGDKVHLYGVGVSLAVLENYGGVPVTMEFRIRTQGNVTDYVWKIILMFGAIPVAMTFYSRMKMALVAKDTKQVAADMSKVLQVEIEAKSGKVEKSCNSFGLFSKEFFHHLGLHLLSTISTLFLLDIAFYSQNLFQKDIFSAIGWIPAAKVRLYSTCHGISAAAGKAGAVIRFWVFECSSNKDKIKTYAESKGKFLDELSGENMEETEITELEKPPVGYTNRIVPS